MRVVRLCAEILIKLLKYVPHFENCFVSLYIFISFLLSKYLADIVFRISLISLIYNFLPQNNAQNSIHSPIYIFNNGYILFTFQTTDNHKAS